MTYDPNDREKPSERRQPANDGHRGDVAGWFIANEAGPAFWERQHLISQPIVSPARIGSWTHDGDHRDGQPDLGWVSEVLA